MAGLTNNKHINVNKEKKTNGKCDKKIGIKTTLSLYLDNMTPMYAILCHWRNFNGYKGMNVRRVKFKCLSKIWFTLAGFLMCRGFGKKKWNIKTNLKIIYSIASCE